MWRNSTRPTAVILIPILCVPVIRRANAAERRCVRPIFGKRAWTWSSPRSYGPTLLPTDTKALSQFIHKGVAGENIVLKSAGTQFFSYLYIADTVAGLLTVLLRGETGEAYNIADERSDITLRDLAGIIAGIAGTEVIFEIPDAIESAGYSKATKARLDSAKLQRLGWSAHYDIREGLERTIEILRCLA